MLRKHFHKSCYHYYIMQTFKIDLCKHNPITLSTSEKLH